MSKEIPFIKPTFPSSNELIGDYEEIIKNNWYTNFGPFEQLLRTEIEKFVAQDVSASTVNNATSGLLAAVLALLGKGDGTKYIIVPSFTFVAGPQAIVWCGYKPLFVDIDAESLQTDIMHAERVIAEKRNEIVGVLLCNTLGVGDPMIDRWETLCHDENLPLIIDSAAGFGSRYADGHYLGGRGDCEIFSFHATKPFAVGEGGAVISRNTQLIAKIDSIQNFGFEKPRNATYLGFNGKLQEVNAAIGLRQIAGYKARLESRSAVFRAYAGAFSSAEIRFQTNAENSSHFCCSIITPNRHSKERILKSLHSSGVQARDYYNPLVSDQSYFTENKDNAHSEGLGVSKDIASRIVSLPVHDQMATEDILSITNIVINNL